ncbi:MAG: hypothetical protein JJE04_25605 [Acidobacteriia bacterium]|nr:hypothetical protein [Terriglobia bacterium]
MNSMLSRSLLGAILAVSASFGAVKSIHVIERSDVLEGKSIGTPGPYERIIAKVHFTVDPNLAPNKIIHDLALAPRNSEGLVEFAADLYVLKPRDPAKGNGAVLFEVSNRGRKGTLTMFNDVSSPLDPRSEKDFGDLFLLQQGYMLAWLGWQFDVPDQPELLRLFTPIATNGGTPITGVTRSEFVPDSKVTEFSLADRNHIAYAVLNPDDPATALTVRDRCDSARTTLPRQSWNFSPDRRRVTMSSGFEPGKIYEVVYTTKDPVVAGLGPAAVRDFISFLKYGSSASALAVLGDQRRFIKRAIGFGTSQSGRFLRTFLYYGFNRDEENRKVFDGVWAHVAGGGRGSFNHRFAQPSRDGHPHMNCQYPTDIFPFTDLPQTDPETGFTGGILERAMADKVEPKVFYTNGSYEYWGRAAGLIHSSIDGKQDADLPAGTRAYLLAGTQHGPGSFPPSKGNTQNVANGNDYRWHMRGLLVGLHNWIKDGSEPPASQYPRVDKDQLVATGALQWPKIPGSTLPQRPQRAFRAAYGPDFAAKGIVTVEPPKIGNAFAALVPQVNADGNETSGIRAPMLQVPLATYTGWNLRAAPVGAPEEIYSMVGSTFFLPRTKAERSRNKDPRPSIEERYKNRQDYLDRYKAAAEALAKDGYLLQSDIATITARGAAQWDAVMRPK